LKFASLREGVLVVEVREPYNPGMAAGKFLDCSAIDSGRRGVYSLLRHREANSQDSQPKSPKEGVRRERKQSLKETKDNFHSSIFIHRAIGDSSSWAAFQTFRFEA
jgi:hypothetical protein